MILLPFDFASHAELFVKGVKKTPDLFSYVSQGPFQTVTDFEAFYKSRILSTNTETLFAILAKPTSANEKGIFAGIIGLQNASSDNATIEIGFVLFPAEQTQYAEGTNEGKLQITVLPAFQHTFVTSNAVGLLLLYTLDLPPAGLGLRRCQWQSHADNEVSKRAATRMQFTFESIQRFQRVVPANKIGNGYDTVHRAGQL